MTTANTTAAADMDDIDLRIATDDLLRVVEAVEATARTLAGIADAGQRQQPDGIAELTRPGNLRALAHGLALLAGEAAGRVRVLDAEAQSGLIRRAD